MKQIPQWLYEVAPDSALNAMDFAAVLGICKRTLNERIKGGIVPPADFRHTAYGKNPKYGLHVGVHHGRQWYIKTVIKYLEALSASPNK